MSLGCRYRQGLDRPMEVSAVTESVAIPTLQERQGAAIQPDFGSVTR